MKVITVHMVGDAVKTEKRDKLISLLLEFGFEARLKMEPDANRCTPCIAIWRRKDSHHTADLLPELNELARNGMLVSVLFEKTPVPSILAPHPVIDLVNWRGSTDSMYFGELLNALRAAKQVGLKNKITSRSSLRLRRFLGGLTLTAILSLGFAFAMNVLAIQNNLCSISFSQPSISDMCGYLGLGDKPVREERLAWEAKPYGSCDALRAHIDRFPDGAMRKVAADLLEGRHTVEEESWVPDEQLLPLFVPIGAGFPDPSTAETEARSKTLAQARQLCAGLSAVDAYRFLSLTLKPDTLDCDKTRSGHYCGYDGAVVCFLERQIKIKHDICGAAQ